MAKANGCPGFPSGKTIVLTAKWKELKRKETTMFFSGIASTPCYPINQQTIALNYTQIFQNRITI